MSARTVRTGPVLVAGALAGLLVQSTLWFLAPVAPAAAASALGPPDPAQGNPVSIGMIIDGHGLQSGSGVHIEQGARAAVSYQNQYRDGLNGHKIELHFCANDETAVGGLLCATDLVHRQVAAVIEPSSGQGPTEVPTLVQAGIPYITMTGGSAEELTTKGAFALEGGVPAILGAVALQAKQKGYSKLTLIAENLPNVVQGTQILGGIVFKAAGVTFNVLSADPHVTDLKPQLQEAIAGGASAIGVGGDAAFCRAFLHAYASLHAHVPKYVYSTCLGPSIVNSDSLDKVLEGSLLAGAVTSSPRDEALYAAIVRKWAPSVSVNPNISSLDFAGLLPVLSLGALMKNASQPVNAAGILARTESAKNVTVPLSGGAEFTCDGTAIPLLMSICSSRSSIGVLGPRYQVTHLKSYNSTSLY